MKTAGTSCTRATGEVAAAISFKAPLLEQTFAAQKYQYRFVDPRIGPEWDRLVGSHPDAGIFHSSAWARVLCGTYGHTPFYFHLFDGNRTVALLPLLEVSASLTGRRGISLPFSDFCSPLFFDDGARSFLLTELSHLTRAKNWKFFELRGGPPPHATAIPFATFYGHQIDLQHGAPELFGRLASSVRGAIRKATKNSVVAEISCTPESLSMFYRLHLRTRRRHGLPPQPFKFFLNIQKELIDNDLGFIVLARAASRTVAAAMFFRSGGTALYKYAASDERYQQLRGSDLVLWEGIQFLINKGAENVHLGRTSLENRGLRRFKLGWAVTEQMLHYFRFDVGRNSWLSSTSLPGTWHKRVFGRLPLKINQLAGAMIYPQLD
ncbi:MAG TPA: GNAT family N-acetyltransferase [Candidatus Udaeobacter sp.]|nr:GNAT family N-acetyltransferase [Candidatus Udaeobacter sp.]